MVTMFSRRMLVLQASQTPVCCFVTLHCFHWSVCTQHYALLLFSALSALLSPLCSLCSALSALSALLSLRARRRTRVLGEACRAPDAFAFKVSCAQNGCSALAFSPDGRCVRCVRFGLSSVFFCATACRVFDCLSCVLRLSCECLASFVCVFLRLSVVCVLRRSSVFCASVSCCMFVSCLHSVSVSH